MRSALGAWAQSELEIHHKRLVRFLFSILSLAFAVWSAWQHFLFAAVFVPYTTMHRICTDRRNDRLFSGKNATQMAAVNVWCTAPNLRVRFFAFVRFHSGIAWMSYLFVQNHHRIAMFFSSISVYTNFSRAHECDDGIMPIISRTATVCVTLNDFFTFLVPPKL